MVLLPTDTTIPLSIEVEGLRSLTWFGATVTCDSEECPPGGGWRGEQASGPDMYFDAGTYSYVEATAHDASLRGGGAFRAIAIGGPLSLSVDGLLRLPGVTSAGSCDSCLGAPGSTLEATGNLTLSGMHINERGELNAVMAGNAQAIRLDETFVDPKILGGAAAVVGAMSVVGVALKALLGFLFTRRRNDVQEESPNRSAIYSAVVGHPGAGFRELTRITGLAVGTVRHHLTILIRQGRIIERAHGNGNAYFATNQELELPWQAVATLRDPHLRTLSLWILGHPEANQTTILRAMGTTGWPRGSTQNRLQRLVDEGLVEATRKGRTKHYRSAGALRPESTNVVVDLLPATSPSSPVGDS